MKYITDVKTLTYGPTIISVSMLVDNHVNLSAYELKENLEWWPDLSKNHFRLNLEIRT